MEILLVTMTGLLLALLSWGIWAYNALVRARNQMHEGWSGIEVQLKRRHELIPNLVKCVKQAGQYESKVLIALTEARSKAQKTNEIGEVREVEQNLGKNLAQFVTRNEAYPELQAMERYGELMKELVEIEDDLQYARRYYNGGCAA